MVQAVGFVSRSTDKPFCSVVIVGNNFVPIPDVHVAFGASVCVGAVAAVLTGAFAAGAFAGAAALVPATIHTDFEETVAHTKVVLPTCCTSPGFEQTAPTLGEVDAWAPLTMVVAISAVLKRMCVIRFIGGFKQSNPSPADL